MALERFRYEGFIFLTGAVALALEVLSSRIMTPYFGVSLFIWSGILSITLAFLALGYYLGGRVAAGKSQQQLLTLYLAGPAAASVAIGVAALVYPPVFPLLLQVNLVLGSFIGGAILLALPLVALSAMNPLLVALRRETGDGADAGAGRVFFVSTVGSVAGVLITAFVFIPAMSNFRALLVLGAVMGGASFLLAIVAPQLAPRAKQRVLAVSALGVVLCVGLAAGREAYLTLITRLFAAEMESDVAFALAAQYSSLYGTVKVVDAIDPKTGAQLTRLYLQDGLVQNFIAPDGTSLSLHTHALEELALGFAPEAKDALVLGLAAGAVPVRFRNEGIHVTVVDINPASPAIAARHFGFDPKGMTIRIEDARTYVRKCRNQFDVVIVDLFHGDGTPDYLMTREFFADAAACLRPTGMLVMNSFFAVADAPNQRVLATLAATFDTVIEFRAGDGGAFLVTTNGPLPEQVTFHPDHIPVSLRADFDDTVRAGRTITAADIGGARPITDDENVFSSLFARAEMELRKAWAQGLPPRLLVN